MTRGKILKVRPGHEANCSSGMIALFMLMIGGVTYLPGSLITAKVQAGALSPDEPKGLKRHLYWFIPSILGLGLAAVIARMAFGTGYNETGPLVVALAMGVLSYRQ